jgi:hypothetical protein
MRGAPAPEPGLRAEVNRCTDLATVSSTSQNATIARARIGNVLGAHIGQPEPRLLRLLSDALCLQLAGGRLHSERALLNRQSAGVVQRLSADRWRERQGRLVLAHGIEGERWDWNADVRVARRE